MTTADGLPRTTSVQSVLGPVPSSELGVTLTHEHILNDLRSWYREPEDVAGATAAAGRRPVSAGIAWELQQDPFGNEDNCTLDDVETAVEEVGLFRDLGGRTILETTGIGIGRDLAGLARVSARTGVTVVAGTGYYLSRAGEDLGGFASDPRAQGPDAVADAVLADLRDGEDGVRPGFIGEIGVGADFTPAEQANLRGALMAQREVDLPIQVHLPGWHRRAHDVLDLVDEVGVDPRRVVLCHMNPSGADLDHQTSLLARGAWLQYDMVGMGLYFADQRAQCPTDSENAAWIARLLDRGHGDQLLISQDVFLKSLLRRNGGPGYGHVLQYFAPRLRELGASAQDLDQLLVANPRALFEGPV